MTRLPDGTAMLVFRNDGDGSCAKPVGAYHNFYQTFSKDGTEWSKPEAIEGSGCAWPEVVALAKGPAIIISGRLCVEGMQGAFLWTHDSPMTPGAAREYARYSIPHYHNAGWSGDKRFLFDDPRGNSSSSFTSAVSSYNGLVALDEGSALAFYSHSASALFALKVTFG